MVIAPMAMAAAAVELRRFIQFPIHLMGVREPPPPRESAHQPEVVGPRILPEQCEDKHSKRNVVSVIQPT